MALINYHHQNKILHYYVIVIVIVIMIYNIYSLLHINPPTPIRTIQGFSTILYLHEFTTILNLWLEKYTKNWIKHYLYIKLRTVVSILEYFQIFTELKTMRAILPVSLVKNYSASEGLIIRIYVGMSVICWNFQRIY